MKFREKGRQSRELHFEAFVNLVKPRVHSSAYKAKRTCCLALIVLVSNHEAAARMMIEDNNPMYQNSANHQSTQSKTLCMWIDTEPFKLVLSDSPAARALNEMQPMTLNMKDLNSNEKYTRLPKSLPKSEYKPEKILPGDVMLFGDDTLVLFYKSFSTSYAYTLIGTLTNSERLKNVLGSGDVRVMLSSSHKLNCDS